MAVCLIAITGMAFLPVMAQASKFKTGDRVDVDLNRSIERLERKWAPAKVMDVMMYNGEVSGIYVKTDDGRELTVTEKDLRPSTGVSTPSNTGPAKTPVGQPVPKSADGPWKPIVDAKDTVLADRRLLDCPITQPKTSRGAKPPVELLKKIIRCSTERPAAMEGSDGAVTMDITKFAVGAPRRWVVNSDRGNGDANTMLYMIEVGYTMTKFYRSGNQIRENIWMYECHVNLNSQWECGTNKVVKEGKVRNIP